MIFGVLSLAAGVASLSLPETAGRPMPTDLADIERLASRSLKAKGSDLQLAARSDGAYEPLVEENVPCFHDDEAEEEDEDRGDEEGGGVKRRTSSEVDSVEFKGQNTDNFKNK